MRQFLIDQGLAIMPGVPNQTIPFDQVPGDGTTVAFTSSMPDEPDQLISIHNTDGRYFGRLQSGRSMQHQGIKVIVRAIDDEVGYDLANAICTAFDGLTRMTVVVNGTQHFVQSIYHMPIISLGEETGKKRQLFSINAHVAFQAVEPSRG